MNVTIFGAGYVGLVQSAVLAEVGHNVMCVDVDAEKVEGLKVGVIPIYEPGLDKLIAKTFKQGNLNFTVDAKKAVEFGEVIFIAVGTPPDEDGSADLKYVLSVANTIGKYSNETKIVVTKSTVPVGTSDKVVSELTKSVALNTNKLAKFHVVSNPEFLKEGSALDDCLRPDRIILGSSSDYAIERMRALYQDFNRNHDRVIVMDVRSSEMTKYAANCMLATKISFMNEMSNIAEALGADIELVRKGIGSDPRIGYQFIYPGCGYGGSCFPKDVKALIESGKEAGAAPWLLSAVDGVNDLQKGKLARYISSHFKGDISGKVVALWGLSFKPNTDDMREAPSRDLIRYLLDNGATVKAYDPCAIEEAKRIYHGVEGITFTSTKDECLVNANFLAVCTEWKEFLNPNISELRDALSDNAVFDGRNIYSPELMKNNGIVYYGIGRGKSIKK
jgi:UDPglucose 6-dehydrogenase